MNNQPSSAIENGFTAQLTKSVTPMPRQCCVTSRSAAKSIFTSIGMIINQIRAATGRFTWDTCIALMAPKNPGTRWPSPMPATMHRKTQRVR